MKQGLVYLIGAGPGDPGLLTLKGRDAIAAADVVIYDYLADAALLRWARPEAERIYAGKQAQRHALSQEAINALLVEKAQAGLVVARLKGGDPFVFGRGGEEALALRAHNLPFEVIPGVTSGIAAPAYAGIPVTHRAVATSFAVVTGHEDPTKPTSGMRWEGLAHAVDTLCFVMGMGNLPTITERLIACGRSADQPAAVIRWGTKAVQETVVGTLGTIAEEVQRIGLQPPALFICGDVVNLREELRWFDNKPLFGRTIVVTRARSQASVLTQRLEELGARVLESPAIQTTARSLSEEEQRYIESIEEYDWLVCTSAQGVSYFMESLLAQGKDVRALGHVRICAIGSATAEALRARGLLVDLIPETYQAESVVAALTPEVREGTRILLVQPVVARTVIPDSIRSVGAHVDIVRPYETQPSQEGMEMLQTALAEGTVDAITFTSSSTVLHTLSLLGPSAQRLLEKTRVAVIGPVTAATCLEEGLQPDMISSEATISALVDALVEGLARR